MPISVLEDALRSSMTEEEWQDFLTKYATDFGLEGKLQSESDGSLNLNGNRTPLLVDDSEMNMDEELHLVIISDEEIHLVEIANEEEPEVVEIPRDEEDPEVVEILRNEDPEVVEIPRDEHPVVVDLSQDQCEIINLEEPEVVELSGDEDDQAPICKIQKVVSLHVPLEVRDPPLASLDVPDKPRTPLAVPNKRIVPPVEVPKKPRILPRVPMKPRILPRVPMKPRSLWKVPKKPRILRRVPNKPKGPVKVPDKHEQKAERKRSSEVATLIMGDTPAKRGKNVDIAAVIHTALQDSFSYASEESVCKELEKNSNETEQRSLGKATEASILTAAQGNDSTASVVNEVPSSTATWNPSSTAILTYPSTAIGTYPSTATGTSPSIATGTSPSTATGTSPSTAILTSPSKASPCKETQTSELLKLGESPDLSGMPVLVNETLYNYDHTEETDFEPVMPTLTREDLYTNDDEVKDTTQKSEVDTTIQEPDSSPGTGRNVSRHYVQREHRYLWCKLCDSYLYDASALRYHITQVHGIENPPVNQYNYAVWDLPINYLGPPEGGWL